MPTTFEHTKMLPATFDKNPFKIRVAVATYVFTIAEAKKKNTKRGIKTSTITRTAASLLCIGDAARGDKVNQQA